MARRTSSGMQALLGLLTIAPMSGYELGRTVRGTVGHIWSESYGQIYPNLKKLTAAGLVKAKIERRKGKPLRCLYSITDKGRLELARWLETPPQAEIPRNEMLLKLFFGTHVPAHVLIGYVERMIEIHRALLDKFTRAEQEELPRMRQYPDVPFWKMTARYGQMEMEAHLRWAEETLGVLRRIDRKQRSASKTSLEKNDEQN